MREKKESNKKDRNYYFDMIGNVRSVVTGLIVVPEEESGKKKKRRGKHV